jgi:hypothetical protein
LSAPAHPFPLFLKGGRDGVVKQNRREVNGFVLHGRKGIGTEVALPRKEAFFTKRLWLELHKRLALHSIDLRFVLVPLIDSAFIRHGRRECATDKRHGRVSGVGIVVQHESFFSGKSLQFVELGQKNRALPLEKISDSSVGEDLFSEKVERSLCIVRLYDQGEFPMPSVHLLLLLLIGGKKKIPYVDHDTSFLVQGLHPPGRFRAPGFAGQANRDLAP